jgi:hypothetical protein
MWWRWAAASAMPANSPMPTASTSTAPRSASAYPAGCATGKAAAAGRFLPCTTGSSSIRRRRARRRTGSSDISETRRRGSDGGRGRRCRMRPRRDSLRRPTWNIGNRNRPKKLTPIMPEKTVTPVAGRSGAGRDPERKSRSSARSSVRAGSNAQPAGVEDATAGRAPPWLLLLEIAQVRRSLAFLDGHQIAVAADDIAFGADANEILALHADVFDP